MTQATIRNSIGLIALVALSACAYHRSPEPPSAKDEQCSYPNTLTCDKFAGEEYNCTCEKADRLKDILTEY